MFVSFLPAGVILSTLFGRRPEGIGRLYFADLLGAAIACAIAVPLMASAGPPATIMLSALLLVVASLRIAARRRAAWPVIGGVLAVALLIGVLAPDVLPEVRLDGGKQTSAFSGKKLVYSSWSPLFRVDVRQLKGQRGLFHDGLLGSVMLKWDGKKSSTSQFGFDNQYTLLPFSTGVATPEQGAHHRRRGRPRGRGLAVLQREAHRRDRAQPGDVQPRHQEDGRLRRPRGPAARRALRERRRSFVPRAQPTTSTT